MRMPLAGQIHFPFSTANRCTVFLFCLLVLASCQNKTAEQTHSDQTTSEPAKKFPLPDTTDKRNFPPPKITLITAGNTPKVVKAGKPTIVYDSATAGAPYFTTFNTEQGLSHNATICSFTDKSGNLWFGTQGGGVSRYDGKSFTNYNIAQGLASTFVTCIIQDRKGSLWFGTNTGISKYDGYDFRDYAINQERGSNNINCMLEDSAGSFLIGTNNGAFRFDGKNFTPFTTLPALWSSMVHSIIKDNAGNTWIGTANQGVIKFDGKAFSNYTTIDGLPENNVQCIMQDRTGNLWFGTHAAGVSRFDGHVFTNYSTHDGLPGNNIWCIFPDKRGNIWISTDNEGLSLFSGNHFTSYTVSDGLADNRLRGITADRAGNLWFGTFDNGVSEYNGPAFTNYTTAQGLANNEIYGILQDVHGHIWFATQNGGSSFDRKSFTNFSTLAGMPETRLSSISQDSRGNIWFGTFDHGAIKYDGTSFTNYTIEQGLLTNRVDCIQEDGTTGDMWFGALRSGVSKYDGKSFTSYTAAQGLANDDIYCMTQDKSGGIWLGSLGGGVSRYDGVGFTNYTAKHGLASDRIPCVIEDKKGNLWLGTDGQGVSKFDGKSFTNYSTTDGLGDDEIYQIADDSVRNMIWLGTNLGFSGLRQTGAADGDSHPKVNTFENFNLQTGFPVKDLNSHAMCIDSKGILWAACGDNKVIRFDYSELNKDTTPPNLEIEKIKINNENIYWSGLNNKSESGSVSPADHETDSLMLLNEMVTTSGKILPEKELSSMQEKYGDIKYDSVTPFYPVPVNLVLPFKDNNVSIEFVAVEPALPKQVKYQYKLVGNDEDWSQPGNNTSAFFGNLREGDYIFQLKAISPYGITRKIEYKFRVLPPWYRTWWAYTIYAFLAIAAIWSLIFYRSRHLRRENRVLEDKVNLRTHQLQEEKEKVESTLSELKSTQAQLIQSEKMASLGELTAGIAHEIQNPLNFINNFSEVNVELAGELQQELASGNVEAARAISNDIVHNEEKISQHGKRADAIVKGMLQHSRSSAGAKELSDINALAEEYLRLSYHGFKAKDNSFHATLKTDFDNTIGKITIIPQNIGRVLLNLYNNAFYAVSEKSIEGNKNYEPTISVSTKKTDNGILLSVRDNGLGIPQPIINKIFQPFFTTKPTGQGIGLGLSMSYDIIKSHGGEITVTTKEGEFTEFVIHLPVG
jgi:ligand-binding sensor domain-containing protein/signal transduction histidine kinase